MILLQQLGSENNSRYRMVKNNLRFRESNERQMARFTYNMLVMALGGKGSEKLRLPDPHEQPLNESVKGNVMPFDKAIEVYKVKETTLTDTQIRKANADFMLSQKQKSIK